MNMTASSYALALCFAAILMTGCGKDEPQSETAPAASSSAGDPIATEGFESGDAKLGSDDEASDEEANEGGGA